MTGDAVRGLPANDLLRNRDFVRFWAGESVSLVGSQITALALPFMAVLVLDATPAQMGLLGALGFLPFLLVTLPAGAWIDRHRRRPVLIAANLTRAALLATIPLAAVPGFLRLGRRDMLAEIREGLRVTFGSPLLRAVAAEAATYNALYQMIEVLILLYLTRAFGLDPATIGLLFTAGAVGSLLGSLVAGRLGERFGVGRSLVASMVLGCSAPLLLPLAGGSLLASIAMIGASFLLGGFGVAVSNVHVVSIRQTTTPDRLLGRMNASYRTVVYGVIPLGALLGGVLGELIGLRATLAIAAIGLLLAPLWVLRTPIPRMHRLPPRPQEAPLGERMT